MTAMAFLTERRRRHQAIIDDLLTGPASAADGNEGEPAPA